MDFEVMFWVALIISATIEVFLIWCIWSIKENTREANSHLLDLHRSLLGLGRHLDQINENVVDGTELLVRNRAGSADDEEESEWWRKYREAQKRAS